MSNLNVILHVDREKLDPQVKEFQDLMTDIEKEYHKLMNLIDRLKEIQIQILVKTTSPTGEELVQ